MHNAEAKLANDFASQASQVTTHSMTAGGYEGSGLSGSALSNDIAAQEKIISAQTGGGWGAALTELGVEKLAKDERSLWSAQYSNVLTTGGTSTAFNPAAYQPTVLAAHAAQNAVAQDAAALGMSTAQASQIEQQVTTSAVQAVYADQGLGESANIGTGPNTGH